MDTTYFFNSLALLQPEVAVTVAMIAVLSFDLIFPNSKKVLPYLSLAGIAVAGAFVIGNFTHSEPLIAPAGKEAMVAIDPFSNFIKLIILIASALIVFFTISSKEMDEIYNRLGEYYTLIFGMILGMMFMATASDLILLYLSLELVSLSSYVLAGFLKNTKRNSEAALKYIIYGGVASGIMLFGISLFYGMTGTTNMFEMNQVLKSLETSQYLFIFSCLLLFTGIGYKISSVPFHFWTPDVYEGAPTTITAYLSVASKAAGFALLIRVLRTIFTYASGNDGIWILLPYFNWQQFIVLIAILTMTLGNFAALWQDNLKRMLAYSSIAHAGYLLAALATLSNQGTLAILLYFIVYLIMNLGGFLIIILVFNKIGSEHIDSYDGLGYKYPLLAVSFGIFLVSLTGLPPTAGFVAKLYVFMALVNSDMITLAVIALLNSVVSLYYYVRVLKHMYLNKPKNVDEVSPISFANTGLVLLLAVPVILFGIYFTPLVEWAKNSVILVLK